LIAVIGRRVVEDQVVDAGGIDGVKLGAASSAFGHSQTPVSEAGKQAPTPTNENAPARRRRGRSVAAERVKLPKHAADGPPVIWIPPGSIALRRISTSLSYPIRVPPLRQVGHNIYGQKPKFHTTDAIRPSE